jgi:hypothetical protein
MKTRILYKLVGLVALTGASFSANAQLLNGGFELGTGAGASNWFQFGNAYREAFTPHSGDNSMKMFGNFNGGFNVTGAFQDFAISPGQSASADGYGINLASDAMSGDNFALIKLIYRDIGNNDLVASESAFIKATTPQDVWQHLTASLGAAPVNTHHGSLFMLFIQPDTTPFAGGAAFFDDLSVQVVPEPASIVAMVAGLGAIALRRRNSK